MIAARVALASLALVLLGCRGPSLNDVMAQQQRDVAAQQSERSREDAVDRLSDAIFNNPDLPAWHEQREKMALALGDRQFDRGFDRVFDALSVALATLGCRVQNMERASGYIAASVPSLPPAQLDALDRSAMREYAVASGFPPGIVEPSNSPDGDVMDPTALYAMTRRMAGLTISIVKQGSAMTKVKLRFSDVYYPGYVDAYYKAVWEAVDKQLFLDRGLD